MSSVTTFPSVAAGDELQNQYYRVQSETAAQRVWDQIFSDAERHELGRNLVRAYTNGGTIGMWVRVHGGSAEQAIIALAHRLGFLNDSRRDWLLRESGVDNEPTSALPTAPTPVLDSSRGVLLFNGKVIRKVSIRSTKSSIQQLLEAFQAAGWPALISEPFKPKPDQNNLSQIINRLNRGLKKIRFRCQAGGREIRWDIQP